MEPATWIAIVAIIVAVASVVASWHFSRKATGTAQDALGLARQAHADTRTVSGIDAEPEIRLAVWLDTRPEELSYLSVRNDGPVDVVQVLVKLYVMQLDDEKVVKGVMAYANVEWEYPVLPAFATRSEDLPSIFLDNNSRPVKPANHNVIAIWISYRRVPDRMPYAKTAFLFVNPDGRWVQEHNSSISLEEYKQIKQAAFGYDMRQVSRMTYMLDTPLHDVPLSEEAPE